MSSSLGLKKTKTRISKRTTKDDFTSATQNKVKRIRLQDQFQSDFFKEIENIVHETDYLVANGATSNTGEKGNSSPNRFSTTKSPSKIQKIETNLTEEEKQKLIKRKVRPSYPKHQISNIPVKKTRVAELSIQLAQQEHKKSISNGTSKIPQPRSKSRIPNPPNAKKSTVPPQSLNRNRNSLSSEANKDKTYATSKTDSKQAPAKIQENEKAKTLSSPTKTNNFSKNTKFSQTERKKPKRIIPKRRKPSIPQKISKNTNSVIIPLPEEELAKQINDDTVDISTDSLNTDEFPTERPVLDSPLAIKELPSDEIVLMSLPDEESSPVVYKTAPPSSIMIDEELLATEELLKDTERKFSDEEYSLSPSKDFYSMSVKYEADDEEEAEEEEEKDYLKTNKAKTLEPNSHIIMRRPRSKSNEKPPKRIEYSDDDDEKEDPTKTMPVTKEEDFLFGNDQEEEDANDIPITISEEEDIMINIQPIGSVESTDYVKKIEIMVGDTLKLAETSDTTPYTSQNKFAIDTNNSNPKSKSLESSSSEESDDENSDSTQEIDTTTVFKTNNTDSYSEDEEVEVQVETSIQRKQKKIEEQQTKENDLEQEQTKFVQSNEDDSEHVQSNQSEQEQTELVQFKEDDSEHISEEEDDEIGLPLLGSDSNNNGSSSSETVDEMLDSVIEMVEKASPSSTLTSGLNPLLHISPIQEDDLIQSDEEDSSDQKRENKAEEDPFDKYLEDDDDEIIMQALDDTEQEHDDDSITQSPIQKQENKPMIRTPSKDDSLIQAKTKENNSYDEENIPKTMPVPKLSYTPKRSMRQLTSRVPASPVFFNSSESDTEKSDGDEVLAIYKHKSYSSSDDNDFVAVPTTSNNHMKAPKNASFLTETH